MRGEDKEHLDLLEKRVVALEELVFGKDKGKKATAVAKGATVTDMLLETQLMISSALSCRDAVTRMLDRLHTINAYLDPADGDELDVQAKAQYLTEMYPQVVRDVQQLELLPKLAPVLDSASIAGAAELSQKLDRAVTVNLGTYEEGREVTRDVLQCLLRYNQINTSLQVMFYELEVALAKLESHAKPVKAVED